MVLLGPEDAGGGLPAGDRVGADVLEIGARTGSHRTQWKSLPSASRRDSVTPAQDIISWIRRSMSSTGGDEEGSVQGAVLKGQQGEPRPPG